MKRRHLVAFAAAHLAYWVAWLARELVLTPMSKEQIDALVIDKPLWVAISLMFAVSVALMIELAWSDA